MMSNQPTLSKHIRSILVTPDTPIFDAVEVLNNAHLRIILISNEEQNLLGVVTDSNVRRAVLRKVDFSSPVSEIMVTSPIIMKIGSSDEEIRDLMERTQIYEIPIVDDDNKIVDLKLLADVTPHHKAAEHVAVVMVGGLGTRLAPLTDTTPKPLIEVGGQPILFTLMDQLLAAGIKRVWLTLNYKGEMIREAIMAVPAYADVVGFIEEKEKMGTAGALTLLPERPTNPFLVLNGDLLTKVALKEMLRFHSFERNMITVALKKEHFIIPYGCARVEGTRILEMQEKPSHTAFINTGVYVVDPLMLDNIPKGKLYDMPDVIENTLEMGLRVGSFPVHEYWLDIGAPSQLEKAQSDFDRYFASKTP